ncbi:MAG: hypothetical protein M1824_002774 [Vezdaea acicularis]|nr:MAG: hypothetical protein M1824_002774 [Vezdaea acicularis]
MFAITVLIGLSLAQSTVSLFLPDTDPQNLVASIISSGPKETAYAISCAPSVSRDQCGYPYAVTVTANPSTIHYAISIPDFSGTIDCSIGGTTTAVCSESFGGPGANFSGATVATYGATDVSLSPIIVTDGAAASQTHSAAATTTTTDSSSTSTKMGTTTTGTAASGKGSSTQTASTSTSGNAAMAQITANPHMAIGGAAIALAFAVM